MRYVAAIVGLFAGILVGTPLANALHGALGSQRLGLSAANVSWGCLAVVGVFTFWAFMKVTKKLTLDYQIVDVLNRVAGTIVGTAQGVSLVLATITSMAIIDRTIQIQPGQVASDSQIAAIRRVRLVTNAIRQSWMARTINDQLKRQGWDKQIDRLPWLQAINESLENSSVEQNSAG